MKTWSRSTTALLAVIAGLFAHAPAATAAELSYGVDLGVGHSDNISRVAEDEQADTIASIGAQLRLNHETKRLRADIATRFEYREYLDDSFDSEVVGNFIGNAVFDIVEDRFTWTLSDTFGQVTQNQFAPVTPDNRENVNYLSTGPDLTLPLGSRNQLIAHGRYVDVNYEDSELGNERMRGELGFRRHLSDATNVSINVTTEQTRFDDDTAFVDFDTNEAFVRYAVDAARTTLSVDAGMNQVSQGGEKNDGWLGRIELTRRATPSLTLGLNLGHQFTDAGAAFASQQVEQPGTTDPLPVQQTATPFETSYGSVSAEFARNRTSLMLRAGYYDDSYDALPLFDRKRITLDLGLSRNLNASLSAHVNIGYSRQQYESLDRKFVDKTATLGVRWNVTRLTFLNVDYQYLDRNDDAAGGDYRANEVWLRFGYLVGEGVSGGFGGL